MECPRPQARALTLAAALLASGCAGIGPTAQRPCYVQPANWRADDQNPYLRMTVLNVGRWCGVAVTADRRAPEPQQAIVAPPTHGRAELFSTPSGLMAQYRPAPFYAGSDSYRFTAGPGAPVITVQVDVKEPPHD